MKEEEFRPIAKDILQHYGLIVIEIKPKQGVLSPDFEAIGKNDKYTIELKEKDDDQEEFSRDLEVLSRGEFVEKSIPIIHRNTMSGIIRKGVKQILAHDPIGQSFRMLWLHSAGHNSSLHYERFHKTLFGSQILFSLNLPETTTCYYFHESAFYSWRNYLDGAILTYNNKAQLCINSLSPRVEMFRKSELVLCMCDGLCDPQKLEEHGDMIADCDIDRKKPDLVKSYLRNKYGLDHLQTINMKEISCTVAVSMDENK